MISKTISLFFVLALLSPLTAASTEEILRGTFYNHNIHASTSEVGQMLKKVDLASHGYRREVTTKLVEGPSGSQRHYHQKSYFFYKVVNCSRIQEVEQELDTLIPGVFGQELAAKLSREIKTRRLNNMGLCKAGLEVLVTEIGNQPGNKRSGVPEKVDISLGFEFGSSSSSGSGRNSADSNDEVDSHGGKRGWWYHGRRDSNIDEDDSHDSSDGSSRGWWYHGRRDSSIDEDSRDGSDRSGFIRGRRHRRSGKADSNDEVDSHGRSRGWWYHGRRDSNIDEDDSDSSDGSNRGWWYHGRRDSSIDEDSRDSSDRSGFIRGRRHRRSGKAHSNDENSHGGKRGWLYIGRRDSNIDEDSRDNSDGSSRGWWYHGRR